MDLKHLDILFTSTRFSLFKPSTWLTYLIQYFSKSKTNHVLILVDIYSELFIAEANGKEVDLFPFYKRKDLLFRVYRLPTAEVNLQKIFSLQKEKYDKKSILRHFLFIVFHKWFGKDKKNSYNCVEFISEVFGFKGKDYATITPATLEQDLKEYFVYGNY